MSDIICLQETWSEKLPLPTIQGYGCIMPQTIKQGRGRGLAVFVKERLRKEFISATAIDEPFAQCLKLKFNSFDVVTVYKTQDYKTQTDYQKLLTILRNLINLNRATVITGDFNFDYFKEKDNVVKVSLEKHGFQQLVTEPTSIRGNCIDHVYISRKHLNGNCKLYYPYFSDHEAIRVIIRPKRCSM